MLTVELLRTRIRKGVIKPLYIETDDPELLDRATSLCELYQSHAGKRRDELEDTIEDIIGDDRDFRISRGLAKLLDDRSEWETESPIEPPELRRRIFERAAEALRGEMHRDSAERRRAEVILSVARELNVEPGIIERSMYADLKAEQRLTRHRPMTPLGLLQRYNVALAQGVLLKARELRVEVAVERPSRLREFYRYLKFHQLMHRTERIGTTRWRMTIDGPASIFKQSQRYGLQIALFLPAILLSDQWAIEADIAWEAGKEDVTFRLASEDGLVSHLKSKGTYQTREEKTLLDRIKKHKSGWQPRRDPVVVDLGGKDVLVPDFVLRHPDAAEPIYVEVVGFWRRSYLERRAEVIQEYGPKNLILCVSRRLKTEKAALGEFENVIDFAEVIPVKKLAEMADRLADL